MKDIEDPVFSTGMMGDGVVIRPVEGKVYAPVDGEIIVIPPTQHAIGFKTKEGIEILVHVGLDSEKIDDEFKVLVKEGDHVKRGALVMTFDIKKLKEKDYAMDTPVIITEAMQAIDIVKTQETYVQAGDNLIAVI